MQKSMQERPNDVDPEVALRQYITSRLWERFDKCNYRITVDANLRMNIIRNTSYDDESGNDIFYNLDLLLLNPEAFQTSCKDDTLKELWNKTDIDYSTIAEIYYSAAATHQLFDLCQRYDHSAPKDKDNKAYINTIVKYADVNYADELGHTALHYSARFSRGIIAEALLKQGAKVSVTNKKGELPYDLITPKSTHWTQRDILTVILAAEDPQREHRMGRGITCYVYTPLGAALKFGLVIAVKAQLDKGADPNKALPPAVATSSLTYMLENHKRFDKEDIKTIGLALIDKGTDLKTLSKYGRQGCLHLAAGLGHYEVCEEILKKRPQLINSLNENGRTPLYYAVLSNDADLNLVKLLLSYSPKVLVPSGLKKESTFLGIKRVDFEMSAEKAKLIEAARMGAQVEHEDEKLTEEIELDGENLTTMQERTW